MKPNQATRPAKTLERVISKSGLGSRTEARRWIHERRVKVNGRIVENPDHWIDLETDRVLFDNRPLKNLQKIFILLNKPAGYITTYRDPEKRPTAYDLIVDLGAWVAPVGRLDLDTSGLLILTNDHDFAERLTNPEFHVPKTYRVRAATLLSDAQVERLQQGVELNDGPTRPAEVRRVSETSRQTTLEITITEGRNRQVRRMLEAVDSKVVELERTGIGPLRIGGLARGTWRHLTPDELAGF